MAGINENFKKIIKRNEGFYYFLYCLKNIRSKNFRSKVLKIKTDPFHIYYNNNGTDRGKIIYHITVGDETKGFCSAIRDTLYFLMYADSLGLVPYIEYTKNMPYQETDEINGGTNSFSYFFEQPADISAEKLKSAAAVADNESIHTHGVFSFYGLDNPESYYVSDSKYIEICAAVYKKYMHLKSEVQCMLQDNVNGLLSGRVLGIHYRGTDFKVGYNGHPVAVPYERHIQEARALFDTGEYDSIFLATEDGDVIDQFKKEFGNKLFLYEDVVRGSGETNAYNVVSERTHHKYRLAYEVFRDVYTLSCCKSFISSLSGVGILSQIIKRSRDEQFEDIIMLDAGINVSKKVLQKYKY